MQLTHSQSLSQLCLNLLFTLLGTKGVCLARFVHLPRWSFFTDCVRLGSKKRKWIRIRLDSLQLHSFAHVWGESKLVHRHSGILMLTTSIYWMFQLSAKCQLRKGEALLSKRFLKQIFPPCPAVEMLHIHPLTSAHRCSLLCCTRIGRYDHQHDQILSRLGGLHAFPTERSGPII